MKRKQGKLFRWLPLALIYLFCLLYVLFQGGKTSIMLFSILNGLTIYLGLGFWSGMQRVSGERREGIQDLKSAEEMVPTAGMPTSVKLKIRVPGYYPISYVIVKDTLVRHDGERITHETSFVPNVKRSGEVTYETAPLHRGTYRFMETECSTRDVFGIFEHTGRFQAGGSFSVRPRTVPLRGWERIGRNSIGPYSYASSLSLSKETTQMNGIREYQPGDRLSRIHWNATARTGQWHSKAFERETLSRTFIVLDASQRIGTRQHKQSFELAVSTAASLFEYGIKSDNAIGLFVSGSRYSGLAPKGGAAQLYEAMELLTKANCDAAAPLLSSLVQAETLMAASSLVFLVTSVGAEEIEPAMSWLSQRGMSVCCLRTNADEGNAEHNKMYKYRDDKWPIYEINRLEELPSVLEGKGGLHGAAN